nr:MAG TPA: hypothetical protein [Caudoviricetes sp.]
MLFPSTIANSFSLLNLLFLRKNKKKNLAVERKKEKERTTAKLLVYIITCSFIVCNLKH